jgi:hypothetical protein
MVYSWASYIKTYNKINLCKTSEGAPLQLTKKNILHIETYTTKLRAMKKSYYEKKLAKNQLGKFLRKLFANLKLLVLIYNHYLSTETLFLIEKQLQTASIFFLTSIASTIEDEIHPSDRPPDVVYNNETLFTTSNTSVTPKEIELQNKRSEDMDGLSMYIVKSFMPAITTPLIHIFNLSFANFSMYSVAT